MYFQTLELKEKKIPKNPNLFNIHLSISLFYPAMNTAHFLSWQQKKSLLLLFILHHRLLLVIKNAIINLVPKSLRKVKPDLCFENLSWHLKILKQNFRQVTIFHVAWVKCNCRRKTPNGYQKFDITEKTIILNFHYYKLKRF